MTLKAVGPIIDTINMNGNGSQYYYNPTGGTTTDQNTVRLNGQLAYASIITGAGINRTDIYANGG